MSARKARLRPFTFIVRQPNDVVREERFYAADEITARKYSRAWCERMKYELVEADDQERDAA